jgi:amidase
MSDAPYFQGAIEVARRLHRRELSPVELARAMLQRIEALEPRLRAYALVTPETALEQARAAEARIARGEPLGPLDGVPIALKDLCCTEGIPTAAGTTLHRDFRPGFDATLVRRLREAGTVLLGKLQMTEGAFSRHHPQVPAPVNPWHREHWTGVSSSGSGVATAAGLCFGSIGSDTGGSIRFPSAANGVTGIKPTWGRVSRHGVFELAASLDHLGPMCRSAEDAGAMLGVIAGHDPDDPTSLTAPVPDYLAGSEDLRGLRVGFDERWALDGVEPVTQRAVRDAVEALRGLGAQVVAVRVPDCEDLARHWGAACAVEAAVAHEATHPARQAEYGPALAGLIELGRSVKATELQRILLRRREFAGRFEALFGTVDLLIIPAQPFDSPTLARMASLGSVPGESQALLRYTAPFDFSGHPTITMPGGFTERGTPVGVQLVARLVGEQTLVRAGRAFQRATDWHRRHPAL